MAEQCPDGGCEYSHILEVKFEQTLRGIKSDYARLESLVKEQNVQSDIKLDKISEAVNELNITTLKSLSKVREDLICQEQKVKNVSALVAGIISVIGMFGKMILSAFKVGGM